MDAVKGFERQCDALPPTDAKRDDAGADPIPPHGVQKPRREHRSGRADGVPVSDGTAVYIHDRFRQAELLHHGQRHRGERFVDLEPLDVAQVPPCAFQRLAHRGHRAESEETGIDGADAVRDQPCQRLQAERMRHLFLEQKHGGSTAVQARSIARRDGARRAEGRLQFRQGFERRIGTVRFIDFKRQRLLANLHIDADDLFAEGSGLLSLRKQALRSFCPPVLLVPRDAALLDQILRVPTRMFSGEGIVQTITKHAVVHDAVTHAKAPTTA